MEAHVSSLLGRLGASCQKRRLTTQTVGPRVHKKKTKTTHRLDIEKTNYRKQNRRPMSNSCARIDPTIWYIDVEKSSEALMGERIDVSFGRPTVENWLDFIIWKLKCLQRPSGCLQWGISKDPKAAHMKKHSRRMALFSCILSLLSSLCRETHQLQLKST